MRPHPILTVLAIVGFYIDLALDAGGGVLPNVLAAPFGLLLLLLHCRRLTIDVIVGLAAILMFYIVNCLIAAETTVGGNIGMLQPAGQFLYSALTVYGVYLDLTLWRRSDVHKFFGWLTGAILIGAALEVYTPFKAVADMFHPIHNMVRHNASDAGTMARDATLYGRPRARLFTSEASFVGNNFALFAAIWMLTAPALTSRRMLTYAAVLMAGLLVIRSPFCILPVFIVMADLVFNRQLNRGRMALSAFKVALFLGVSILGLIAAGSIFTLLFAKRLRGGPDWSIIVRTYGAIAAGWNVALEHPLFGMGAGNFDGFRDVLVATYHALHVPDYVLMSEILTRSLNNGLGATLAFFGFGGGAIYLALQVLLGRALAPVARGSFILAALLLIFFTTGAVYSPKGVWPMFLILGAMTAGAPSTARAVARTKARPSPAHFSGVRAPGAVARMRPRQTPTLPRGTAGDLSDVSRET